MKSKRTFRIRKRHWNIWGSEIWWAWIIWHPQWHFEGNRVRGKQRATYRFTRMTVRGRVKKEQEILLTATKDRKSWIVMIAHFLKLKWHRKEVAINYLFNVHWLIGASLEVSIMTRSLHAIPYPYVRHIKAIYMTRELHG